MRGMKNPSLLWLDVVVVFAFVVMGRRTHDEAETMAGVLRTAAPFMLALAAGWTVLGAWRRPAAMSVGAGVLAVTVVVGMLLRHVLFDEGTAATFVVVATAFLALGFLGWRLVAKRIAARSNTSPAAAE
jgi:peptidoglycan/LPS O-acetylase OafA/YrhL